MISINDRYVFPIKDILISSTLIYLFWFQGQKAMNAGKIKEIKRVSLNNQTEESKR